MILDISSSLSTFKPVKFHHGLNVLVADATPGSSDRQTRNSAGKTSLVEIIHFLLGADCNPDSLFRSAALVDHSFSGAFILDGKPITVSRSGGSAAKILILKGGEDRDGLTLKIDPETDAQWVSNTTWKTYLGHAIFGLPVDPKGTIYEPSFTPSFRSMIAYFARRRNSGGYIRPENSAEKQRRADWQVNLSYLFGLDWRIPNAFNKVRERERMLVELKKAARGGALGEIVGTVAELRPQLTMAQARADRLRSQLAGFEVLDSYRDLTTRAARAKTTMQNIGREIVSLQETLNHLEAALAAETAPQQSTLLSLYQAAGVELPGVALRRFEEVRRFHTSVISNRRIHLEDEVGRVRRRLTERDRDLNELNLERSEILRTLEGQGALEDFLSLQRNLAELEQATASLRDRFRAAEMLEGESTQLTIDRGSLKQRLQADHQARSAPLERAIIIVGEAIAGLYEDRTGRLVVGATDNGPEFHITIEGDRGGGISNMEIFCFDLALLGLSFDRGDGPGFLIHDSHLFDGVDERQVAAALVMGQRAADSWGQQYIVTMNSDIFDRLPLPESFDKEQVVIGTRLSDDTETGGLFGFRFD